MSNDATHDDVQTGVNERQDHAVTNTGSNDVEQRLQLALAAAGFQGAGFVETTPQQDTRFATRIRDLEPLIEGKFPQYKAELQPLANKFKALNALIDEKMTTWCEALDNGIVLIEALEYRVADWNERAPTEATCEDHGNDDSDEEDNDEEDDGGDDDYEEEGQGSRKRKRC